jgi:predicted nucleotidyltransferase
MELSYVQDHTIFECVVGSQAYGLSTVASDIDRAGVMIPEKEYFLGLKNFDQFTGYGEEDKTVYNFKRIIKLIADNNPNCMDLLCIPDRCVVKNSEYWQKVMDNAHLFISKKCKFTFTGYAISQLNRIRTHKEYLLHPVTCKPLRQDFGLQQHSMFETSAIKSIVHIESLFEYIAEEEKEIFLGMLDTIYGEQIEEYVGNFEQEMDVLYTTSTLQKTPQIEKIDLLCQEVLTQYFTDGAGR